jgi:hypothetical protein
MFMEEIDRVEVVPHRDVPALDVCVIQQAPGEPFQAPDRTVQRSGRFDNISIGYQDECLE